MDMHLLAVVSIISNIIAICLFSYSGKISKRICDNIINYNIGDTKIDDLEQKIEQTTAKINEAENEINRMLHEEAISRYCFNTGVLFGIVGNVGIIILIISLII